MSDVTESWATSGRPSGDVRQLSKVLIKASFLLAEAVANLVDNAAREAHIDRRCISRAEYSA